ncbi:MAG: hypothetical protein EX271_13020 [Acidimicrobiales bacterium]|nr:hypothetical protein [Hyphomonadaceae bacterium]RZV35273.1 MAG: hypothetical protein EX271_13020 [Acidimicrobiales bacterium]
MTIFTKSKIVASLVTGSMILIGGCATQNGASEAPAYKLTKNDIHFPKRTVSDLDQALVTNFRADLTVDGNCLYATNVRGKAPSKKYVLTWPMSATMEYMGKDLTVVSSAAGTGAQARSSATIGDRVEFTGVLKEIPFKHRVGYHAPTEFRNCKAPGIARVAAWKTVRKAQ